MRTANRVALNSIALYVNMVVSMFTTLLATRYLLSALGKQEYGVYALVANIVAMFSFLNVSMAASTQRFLSYSMGEGDEKKLKNIFSTSITIHVALSILLFILLIAFGVPGIKCWLEIPSYLHNDAIYVLFCMSVSTAFIVLSVPYEGAMNAHEDIHIIAFINIVDSVIKLLAAIIVFFLFEYQLVVYASLILLSSVVAFCLKMFFAQKHYEESKHCKLGVPDKNLLKGMVAFAGWNLIGAGCSLLRYQGASVILNKFFGLVVNAAYGVAQQLNGFLMFFSGSSVRPLRPLIMKSEGVGNHKKMVEYSFSTSKLTFMFMLIVVAPLYFHMPYVLELWLGAYPVGALMFCRGFLLIVLIGQLSIGLQLALESTGRIKRQQIIVGTFHLLPLVVTVFLYINGYGMEYIMYTIIVEEIICLFLRMWIARGDADVPAMAYAGTVLLPSSISAILLFVTLYISSLYSNGLNPFLQLCLSILIVVIYVPFVGYKFCLSACEKDKFRTLCKTIYYKITRKLP